MVKYLPNILPNERINSIESGVEIYVTSFVEALKEKNGLG